ncbi:hypothetical protein [Paenibacillus xylanivorans]|nr:hypothetical protein [Paenibacillus xylanivorans]
MSATGIATVSIIVYYFYIIAEDNTKSVLFRRKKLQTSSFLRLDGL